MNKAFKKSIEVIKNHPNTIKQEIIHTSLKLKKEPGTNHADSCRIMDEKTDRKDSLKNYSEIIRQNSKQNSQGSLPTKHATIYKLHFES